MLGIKKSEISGEWRVLCIEVTDNFIQLT